ncbi:MAG: hypothetical protein MKZ70_05825, partial [Opitutales bacterium]|nr:hypothetical protein [Opitutales bacterium]
IVCLQKRSDYREIYHLLKTLWFRTPNISMSSIPIASADRLIASKRIHIVYIQFRLQQCREDSLHIMLSRILSKKADSS